jgi:hypothetical protein
MCRGCCRSRRCRGNDKSEWKLTDAVMTYNDSHDIAPGVDSLNGTNRRDLPVLCHSGPLFWPRGLRAGALDVDDCTNFTQSDAEIKLH